MPETDISKMNFKQLKNEVQLLRDELAVFKRKYEDAIYNLDNDNFGKSFTLEQNNMKALIKITADAVKTKVSEVDLNKELENYSTLEQTASEIKTTVNAKYVTDLIGDKYVTNAELSSEIRQSEEGIYSTVSLKYETKEDAQDEYGSLTNKISEVNQTANSIEARVTDVESFKTSVFTQTAYGFTLDGEQTTFTGVIYLTDDNANKRYSIFHDTSQGFEQVLMHSTSGNIPLVLGDTDGNVYIGSRVSGREAATRDWVNNNAFATAVFG